MKQFYTPHFLALGSIITLSLAACRKEPDKGIQPRDTFPIEYHFVNLADPNVKAAVIYTTTFFPNDTISTSGDSIDRVTWHDQAFRNLHPADQVQVHIPEKGYVACITQFKIRLVFEKPMFSPILFNAGWGEQSITNSRNYVGTIDTIRSPTQNIIRFIWPDDTLKFTEVEYFQ